MTYHPEHDVKLLTPKIPDSPELPIMLNPMNEKKEFIKAYALARAAAVNDTSLSGESAVKESIEAWNEIQEELYRDRKNIR